MNTAPLEKNLAGPWQFGCGSHLNSLTRKNKLIFKIEYLKKMNFKPYTLLDFKLEPEFYRFVIENILSSSGVYQRFIK